MVWTGPGRKGMQRGVVGPATEAYSVAKTLLEAYDCAGGCTTAQGATATAVALRAGRPDQRRTGPLLSALREVLAAQCRACGVAAAQLLPHSLGKPAPLPAPPSADAEPFSTAQLNLGSD